MKMLFATIYNQTISGNCCNFATLLDWSHNVANYCKILYFNFQIIAV